MTTASVKRNSNTNAAGRMPAALTVSGAFTAFTLLSAVLLVMLLIALTAAGPVYAEDNNGADAHSRSMSMGTGGDPVPDGSTTLDYGQGDAETGEALSEEETAAAGDTVMSEDEDQEGKDAYELLTGGDDLREKVTYALIAVVCLLTAALLVILMIRTMKRRR